MLKKIVANSPGHKGTTYILGNWQLRISKYAVGENNRYCHTFSITKKRTGEF